MRTTTIGIAIDIPEPFSSVLRSRRAAAGDPQAQYVPAHLTLLPPTEVDRADVARIDAHLAQVATEHAPFTLHLRGTGTFRPVTDVVFVAVAAGISECELLAEAVCAMPAIRRPLRFPYHPHVTVAQDVAPEALDAVFGDLAHFEARFPVGRFTLFDHDLGGRWRAYRDYRLTGVSPLDGRR
jgi:2'-5' RNA ligase